MSVWEFWDIYNDYLDECYEKGITPMSESEYWAEMEEG